MKTKNKILIGKYISKFITFFISKHQIVSRGKIKWSLNLEEGIDLSIYLFGTSEKKISNVRELISKKKNNLTIVDIGANVGSVSLVMAKMFENSRIYAIEPTDYAFNKLSTNLRLNKDIENRVNLRQIFITNNKKPSMVWSSWNFQLTNDKHHKHFGTLKEIKKNSYLKLNEFIDNENIKNIDFIKLDVDGYELDVLKSGEDFIKKNKPIIFIEIAPYLYPEFGYKCKELINFIENLNYSFYDDNLKKIQNIFTVINNIKDGSSKNFFLV